MDCDDNDFHSQNFQLIGEDSDGFPRSLQSYAPPKFDIDDHFQAHLRFDSLADPGLFLGIQGEENNWIEEFSPRNSAVEFGSSASQTCCISGHGNIWSNAPSSESARMLVKSVGDDETVSPQVMNTGAETLAIEDSTECETKSTAHNDSTRLTTLHNNILGSTADIDRAEQHGVTQTPSVEKSDVGLDINLLDQDFPSAGKVAASQCTINEETPSSSGDVSKECLVAGELLEVVQSKEPFDNASMRSSSLDDRGRSVNRDTEVSSSFLSCNTQDGPSSISADNAGNSTSKLDNSLLLQQKMEECSVVDLQERSEALQSETKQNETSYNLYGKMNDQHFEGHAVNFHVCDAKDSSELVSRADSLVFPNEESTNSVLFKNSDGLLEAIAYQVKVLNKDTRTGDKSSAITKEVPSLAVEKDGIVGRNSVEVSTENIPKLCDIAGPIDFSHGVHEYISKDDGLNRHAPSTKESKVIVSEEEIDLAISKAVINDNNSSELRSSSDMAVNDCRNDLLSSKDSDTVQTEKGAEVESLNASEKSNSKLDASEHAILKEPCAALLDDVENDVSSSVHDKLAPSSDTSSLLAELNEDSVSQEDKENTVQLIDSSGTNFKDCSTVIENTGISSFETQNNGNVMESDKKSNIDQEGGVKSPSPHNSAILQQLHTEIEVIAEHKEVAVSPVSPSRCNDEDVHLSSLSVTRSNTDTQLPSQPHAVPDSDGNGSSIKNFGDGLETANNDEVSVASSTGVPSFATCQNTEGKDANLVPKNYCDKTRLTETEVDTLKSDRNNIPQSALPESNLEPCLLDPDASNLNSLEPDCGSPTVISCNEHTLEEMEHRESNSSVQDPSGCASETTKSSACFKCAVEDSKMNTTSENDGNFTFVVQPDADLTQNDSNKDRELFSNTQTLEQPQIVKESSQGHLNETIKESTSSTISKTIMVDKRKQASGRATRNVGISKGDGKERSQGKQGKGRKKNPCSTSPVPDIAARGKTHLEGVQQCLNVETSTTKSSFSPSLQTSNLPDLNTSAPPVLFHQPFTDLQQVQLRAQIFVYGSLIQGVLPDEACMIPAFGGTDGGRGLWERAWFAASERFHNLKSPRTSSGTHLHYHSEQAISCSPLQKKAFNSPAGLRDSKVPISAIQCSTVSVQSPFQSSSNDGLPSAVTRGTHLESTQSLSPLHSYQTSQIRQYLTNSTPWLSQSPCPASWIFPTQSSPFDSSTQNSVIPAAETAQMPVRVSPIPHSMNMQLASLGASMPNQGAISVSGAIVVSVETQTREATSASIKNISSEKSRKRKKVSAPEELVPKISVSEHQTESASAAFIPNNLPNSAGLSLSSNSPSTVASAGLVCATSHSMTMPYCQILGNGDSQQRVTFSKENCTQIEHSKLQAENASAFAVAAVRHSQVIWEQMAVQRESGLASGIEEKLVSAAVSAAAAATVAKAAAEVAKIASEAALQAKLLADEALNSVNGSTQKSEISLDIGKNLLTYTPTSISKDKDAIHGPSIISTARETTRKRVEAASAAIKRAENLDAILKAAEMAAEAVSQVGTVVAMGDPLPFSISELVEAGPEGHWKLHCATMKNGAETNVQARENLGLDVAGDHEITTRQSTEQPSSHNERQKVSVVDEISPNNKRYMLLGGNHEGCELKNGSKIIPTDGTARDPMLESSIQKGSFVEVVSDEDGLRGAWFSAQVLDVKDGQAYVCYKDLLSDGDHGKLKEWIPLESKSEQPPRIRVAHPVIVPKSEGTRKRRREAIGNCTWAVGDRVDAWLRDGWWEGIITEKSQDDETKLTVHFPAGGDSSIVRSWNLRPSLVWKEGQWIEWSRANERVTLEPYEGDTPQEKRQKLGLLDAKGQSEIGQGGMGALSRNIHTDDSMKLEESRPLNLSAKDVIFSVGKNVGGENNTDVLKVRRAGLQKDGSTVVFGVPKPGKKRKFMEVSKHYTIDKTEKATERSDSLKFAKYLMPQASQLWRTTTKVDIKDKRATNLNSRGSKSLRSQNVHSRSTVDKNVLNAGESNLRTTFSGEEKKSSLETGSLLHVPRKVELAGVEPSVQPVPGIPSSKKKSSSVEAETEEKGKVLSAVDQLSSSEIKGSENAGKGPTEVVEPPRRSNRRIQPTSKLLEGLQSSLIISKSSGVSHDRGAKTSHRGGPTSRGQSHR